MPQLSDARVLVTGGTSGLLGATQFRHGGVTEVGSGTTLERRQTT